MIICVFVPELKLLVVGGLRVPSIHVVFPVICLSCFGNHPYAIMLQNCQFNLKTDTVDKRKPADLHHRPHNSLTVSVPFDELPSPVPSLVPDDFRPSPLLRATVESGP
jgi:hypothetical protein